MIKRAKKVAHLFALRLFKHEKETESKQFLKAQVISPLRFCHHQTGNLLLISLYTDGKQLD